MSKYFNLGEYISALEFSENMYEKTAASEGDFYRLCEEVKERFYADWDRRESSASALEMQKKAIIGFEKEKQYFIRRSGEIIEELGKGEAAYPPWYGSLEEAVYAENWGMAGLSEWFRPEYAESSSAKIIGERIYFMEEGRMRLKPQKIGEERFRQLVKSFLLLTPEERMDREYYECYLLDGTRVTIFTEPMAKKGEASVILRRYLIPSLSFEEQARRKTIPYAAIPLFRDMVAIGYNVVFAGAVRTAKTTFLSTWQSCEDPALEGVMVETDPEIPMHRILPDSPIIQLLADGESLSRISKNILRSDADYFILAEARDGNALDTAVRLACKGTKRMKLTFHTRRPEQFPLEAAYEILRFSGGNLEMVMRLVASSFDYIFHFIQLADKREKRLSGIYQMNCDSGGRISVESICSYDRSASSWTFRYIAGEAQMNWGMESEPELFSAMMEKLKDLERISREGGVF